MIALTDLTVHVSMRKITPSDLIRSERLVNKLHLLLLDLNPCLQLGDTKLIISIF